MAKIHIPEDLAPEVRECGGTKLTEWEAPNITLDTSETPLHVPFRIHVDRYKMVDTTFKLINYKSVEMTTTCPENGKTISAHLLFDDEGRSFGLFMENLADRYLFQHSPDIDKEAYLTNLLDLEFID